MNSYNNAGQSELSIIMFFIVLTIIMILAIFNILGFWRTLQKMGRHDFAALVPGYNMWELSRGAGFSCVFATIFVILFAIQYFGIGYLSWVVQQIFLTPSTLLSLSTGVDAGLGALVGYIYVGSLNAIQAAVMNQDILTLVSLVCLVIYYIMYLIVCWGVARSFGHGFGYFIGLIILPPIFFMLLGYSSNQIYRGPYFDKDQRSRPLLNWPEVIQARKETFGSNAPLALSLIGMYMGAFLLTIPGIALCIVALVKNSSERQKPLAGAKCTVTSVVSVMGIVIALVVAGAFFFIDGLGSSVYYYFDLVLPF